MLLKTCLADMTFWLASKGMKMGRQCRNAMLEAVRSYMHTVLPPAHCPGVREVSLFPTVVEAVCFGEDQVH